MTLDLPPSVDEARARLALAVGLFQGGDLTLGRAAEVAGLDYRAFADALAERGVPLTVYTREMLDEDIAAAREIAQSAG